MDSFSLPSNTHTVSNFNIRSIPKNLQYFKDLIINNISTKISVLGFTEVRLEPHLTSMYEIPGYSMYVNPRNINGGGVAIYVSDEYDSAVLGQLTFSELFIESLGVIASVASKKYLFVCIYRPPRGTFNSFLSTLNDILCLIFETKYHGVFVFGDFNVNLLKSNEANVSEFINLMHSFSLFPMITKPTRVSNDSATLIDHIWTTQFEQSIGNYIIVSDISDHYPTMSQFSIELSKSEPQYIFKRLINTSSLNNFNDNLSQVNWDYILNSTCPSDAFSLFYNNFCKLFEKSFPIKQICVHRKHDLSPYITSALKTSIKENIDWRD